jgi:1-deoxyxylulose-5-phosphate synthase
MEIRSLGKTGLKVTEICLGTMTFTTAVRWVMKQAGITSVLIGASHPEQLDASLRAAQMNELTKQDLEWLDGLWFSLPRRCEFS